MLDNLKLKTMRKQILITFLFIILTGMVCGQTKNLRDAAGRKQGYWESVDSRGKPVYAGYFKDDKPVGEMKRYYPAGGVRVILHYSNDGISAHARFFWENGKPAAQGKYINTKRDSIWLFYNQNNVLSSRAAYSDGNKNGQEQKFYKNGNIAEEIFWKNGLKDGTWKQYYNNGKMILEATYIGNKLEGEFKSFLSDGSKELDGFYSNGSPDGEWKRYDANGNTQITIKYNKGTITNMAELKDSEVGSFLKLMDEERFIPEPSIEDMLGEMQ
jgi:antitoxin component YwqK of YwqJK toxin-antitoxin module